MEYVYLYTVKTNLQHVSKQNDLYCNGKAMTYLQSLY